MKSPFIILAFSLSILIATIASAQPQPPDTLWTRTFGGNNNDWGKSVQQTTDGGFIIV